jgi:4-oxalomesaconate tautomerase
VSTSQRTIPCLFFRGGTSRGPFFDAGDLPTDRAMRDAVLLAVMGSPDRRQIDGLGGAHPLTSKVGIVSRSDRPGVDLDFLFAQLQPESDTVDTTPNCGNMLAAVVPFAIETGMVPAADPTTTVRVHTVNTGMDADITVRTPCRVLTYDGDARIDGAPGTSAPIAIEFLDTAGSVCSGLLPTGHLIDTIDDLSVTCIDNGMPMVLFRAEDVERTGRESVAELNADEPLKARIERLRLAAGHAMGLGDVSARNYPKMCLLSAPEHGGAVSTRCFIPHVCHDSIGVLAAVTVATACVLPGTVAHGVARTPEPSAPSAASPQANDPAGHSATRQVLSVEHPSGEFSLELGLNAAATEVTSAALVRTARLLLRGEVCVPWSVWPDASPPAGERVGAAQPDPDEEIAR